MPHVPVVPIGVKEWAGPAGFGHGAGLLAANLTTSGASVKDLPAAERKQLLESGSNVSALGTIVGGAAGAGLGGYFGGGDSLWGHLGAGLGGAVTGGAIGGLAAPAAHSWYVGRKMLRNAAMEKAEPEREEREREEAGMKSAAKGEMHTITLEANDAALPELTKLLSEIIHLSGCGASRSIKVEDFGSFYIDGDGSDRIKNLKVDGELHHREKSAEAEDDECWATEFVKEAAMRGAMLGGAIGGVLGGATGTALQHTDADRQRGFVYGTGAGIPIGALLGSHVEDEEMRQQDEAERQQAQLEAMGFPKVAGLGTDFSVGNLALYQGMRTPFVKRTQENMNTPEAQNPDYHMKGRNLGVALGHIAGKGLGIVGGGLIGQGLGDAAFGQDSFMTSKVPLFDQSWLPQASLSSAAGGIAGNFVGGYGGALAGGALGSEIGHHIKGPGQQNMPKAAELHFAFLSKLGALGAANIDSKGLRTRLGYHRWLASKRMQPASCDV